jgi:hypothetical protein
MIKIGWREQLFNDQRLDIRPFATREITMLFAMHTTFSKWINMSGWILLCVASLLSFSQNAVADEGFMPGQTIVQGGHSGAFGDKDNDYNGIFVEVLNSSTSPTGKRLLITWYAFFNGQQVWLLAVGDVIKKDGKFVAVMDAWIYEGNDFPPNYDDSQTLEIVWGEIIFVFDGCDEAIMDWDSVINGFGSGRIYFERVTSIADTVCNPALGSDPVQDDLAPGNPV